ncbi:hypothetical protein JNK13_11190 [bacterium]|nr:hypothetical protein [bacterium]
MSYRPEIIGFNSGRFLRLLGSNDQKALEEISTHIVSQFADDKATSTQCLSILKTAITESLPLPNLEEETYEHSCVAEAIMRYDQDLMLTNSNILRWSVMSDMISEFAESPNSSDKIDHICHYITNGRPIFGQSVYWESPYFYLLNSELITFTTTLASTEFEDFESIEPLVKIMSAIGSNGLDMWCRIQ